VLACSVQPHRSRIACVRLGHLIITTVSAEYRSSDGRTRPAMWWAPRRWWIMPLAPTSPRTSLPTCLRMPGRLRLPARAALWRAGTCLPASAPRGAAGAPPSWAAEQRSHR